MGMILMNFVKIANGVGGGEGIQVVVIGAKGSSTNSSTNNLSKQFMPKMQF